jgi:hypothetical protein
LWSCTSILFWPQRYWRRILHQCNISLQILYKVSEHILLKLTLIMPPKRESTNGVLQILPYFWEQNCCLMHLFWDWTSLGLWSINICTHIAFQVGIYIAKSHLYEFMIRNLKTPTAEQTHLSMLKIYFGSTLFCIT